MVGSARRSTQTDAKMIAGCSVVFKGGVARATERSGKWCNSCWEHAVGIKVRHTDRGQLTMKSERAGVETGRAQRHVGLNLALVACALPVGWQRMISPLRSMLRCRLILKPLVSITRCPSAVRRTLSSARDSNSNASDDDNLRTARSWLASLHAEAIPLKSIGELTFSRSSGPGGQNVNKYDQRRKNSTARYTKHVIKESILKLL